LYHIATCVRLYDEGALILEQGAHAAPPPSAALVATTSPAAATAAAAAAAAVDATDDSLPGPSKVKPNPHLLYVLNYHICRKLNTIMPQS